MIDLRTEKERETSRRKDIINVLFDQIDKESGNQFSTWRICVRIAESVGCTPHNVYQYCKRLGKRSYADRHRYDDVRGRIFSNDKK